MEKNRRKNLKVIQLQDDSVLFVWDNNIVKSFLFFLLGESIEQWNPSVNQTPEGFFAATFNISNALF